MNKSYKCDFCKYDSPVERQSEICSNCKFGSKFELKKRMSERQKYEWEQHVDFDASINEAGTKLLDAQYELSHRVLEYILNDKQAILLDRKGQKWRKGERIE